MSSTIDRPGPSLGAREVTWEIAKRDPEMARALIVEQGTEVFAQGLLSCLKGHRYCYSCGCAGRHPWAFRLFAQVSKLVGMAPEVVNQILVQIGVRDVGQAQRAVRMVGEIESMPEAEQAAECAEFLRRYNAAHPEAEITL